MWPKTKVVGTVTVKETGEVISIDGRGYREDSWGRYLLPLDGWDFLVYTDEEDDGVIAVLQTYHRSQDLDYLDLRFKDGDRPVFRRFSPKAGTLTWHHTDWGWDSNPNSCVPNNLIVSANDGQYSITIHSEIGKRQSPLLSNATLSTRMFFIQEHFPQVKGTIRRVSDNKVLHQFSGQAGGEFSYRKQFFGAKTPENCRTWGNKNFGHTNKVVM